jgi:hypothetical protein
VIGAPEVALATKWTGDPTVDPDEGDDTETEPANATAVGKKSALTTLQMNFK